MKQKKCITCRKLKDISEFSKRKNIHKTKTIYYCSLCKECMVERMTQWVIKNRKQYNKYQNEYHNTN